jgi:hypothetical protein
MPAHLKLREIFLGNIDAKNELVAASEQQKKRFLAGFLIPPTVILDEVLSGERYFVTGMKGIGKTSLLKYIEILLNTRPHSRTQFFLFKSRLTEDDRKSFTQKASGAQLVTTDTDSYSSLSYEALWKWFIYKSLISLTQSSLSGPFVADDSWRKFSACGLAPQREDEPSGIRRLLPKLSGGKVSISSSPSLDIDFDWDNKEARTVSLTKLTKQAEVLFSKLNPSGTEFTLLFDELEIDVSTPERRLRDIELIRDLVLSIEQFNYSCRENGYAVRILAAIRTEVLSAINSIGKEINKTISDFGIPIVWNRGGVTALEHPLIDIVLKRILSSEENQGISEKTDRGVVWNRYFPKELGGKPAQDYLLGMTWLRPRDLVRLLNIAKSQFPEGTSFNDNAISASRKEYSYQSWIELAEELSTRYSKEDIEAIRVLFSGYSRYFDASHFSDRIGKMSPEYKIVAEIAEKTTPYQLLADLYNVGVVGNASTYWKGTREASKYRFHYKGDYHPIMENTFMVHNALCPFFGLN